MFFDMLDDTTMAPSQKGLLDHVALWGVITDQAGDAYREGKTTSGVDTIKINLTLKNN